MRLIFQKKNWLCENHHHCTLWAVILNYRCDCTPCLWANQSLFSLAWIDHFWTIFWFIKTLSFSVSLLPLEAYFLSRLINLIRYEYKVVSENTFTLTFFCMIVHDQMVMFNLVWKGWGQSVKLGPHSAIWGKLGTTLRAYALNPCTKFPPNPTSRKVNT